jgi:hypothetical protein
MTPETRLLEGLDGRIARMGVEEIAKNEGGRQ